MTKKPITRRRDAVATRAAILAAAHQRFMRESYDSVGLRDIAGDVGVDVALIGRYFGGKEGLFGEVLTSDERPLLSEGMTAETMPDHLCQLVTEDVNAERDHRMEMFIIMLRSASSPKAGKIIRRIMGDDILQPLADQIGGESAQWRANMLLALMMGVSVLRTVMESDGLNCMFESESAYKERLRGLFEAVLQA